MEDSPCCLLSCRKPRTEGRRFSARGGHVAEVVGSDMLVCFGGHCYGGKGVFEYFNDTMVLELDTNTWQPVKTGGRAPEPRYGHKASIIGNKMYIFGGCGPKNAIHGNVFCLETETWCWNEVSTTNMGPAPRHDHGQTLIGEKMVIFGGWDGYQTFKDLWILDLNTNTWMEPETTGFPPRARQGHTMQLTDDGRLLVFGGCSMDESGYPTYLNDLVSLDVKTMEWSRPRISGKDISPRCKVTSCMVGKKMFVFGGFVPGKKDRSDKVSLKSNHPVTSEFILVLDTDTYTWSSPQMVGNCPDEIYGQSASLLDENQIILYGGWGGNRALDELFVAKVAET